MVDLRLTSGEQAPGPEEDLFTQEAPADKEAGEAAETASKGGGMTLPLIFLGVVIIVLVVVARRRRS